MRRVLALWGLLLLWCAWYLSGAHALGEGHPRAAAMISLVVGIILNTLNWEPVPGRGSARLLWALRVAGNFAVPFAVSVTARLIH